VLAIAGGTCVVLASRADTAPAVTKASARSQASEATLATPLWSPRRVPTLFGAAVAAAHLHADLAHTLSGVDGCVTVASADGPVTAVDPGQPLAGASTQKLLVAAAATAALGGDHRFETRAVADGDVRDGTVDGDLTIIGGGDPVLSTSTSPSTAAAPVTRLDDLADAIVRAGVRRVTGAIAADDTRYERARAVASWDPTDVEQGQVGALGALIVDGGRGTDQRAVADPALATVRALADRLAARGVVIDGRATHPDRSAPESAREIARVASPPLHEIVAWMLLISDNETAEMLTRALGVARAHDGSTAAGTRAVAEVLAGLGVPTAGVSLADGSGLSAANRVTCPALMGAVALGETPRFAGIADGLPVAGRSGTLLPRFLGTSLAGRLRAKTGHITDVSGLAGDIPAAGAAGDDRYRFASLVNGAFSTDEGAALVDGVATRIGGYIDHPDAPEAIPAPG
jgi:D-alanyl-D-alanine carboxypeptidase/D-alanyl-D-alanine-endopeptidase (penicillin-binding protein 4)